MDIKIRMGTVENTAQEMQTEAVTQQVTQTSTMPPAQEEVVAVENVQNSIPQAKSSIKGKRLNAAEKKELTEIIKSELLEAHPLQAIALKHNLTMPFLLKLFAELMQSDFRTEVKHPGYEVCSAGTPASKLPFKMLENAKYIRVKPHANGLYIQPFKLKD